VSMQRINLVPLARQHAAARRHRTRRWAWIVGGYFLLTLAGFGACVAAIGIDSDDTGASLEKTTRQIEELNRTIAQLHPQLADSQTKLLVARTVGDQPDWSELLSLVATTVDDQIALSGMKMDSGAAPADVAPATRPSGAKHAPASGGQQNIIVAIQGFARSQPAVSQFVLRLERLGLFERVDLVSSGRQSVGDIDAHGFRIECELRRSGSVAPSATPQGRDK
jgi:Tfp pilus assembly protein PilN